MRLGNATAKVFLAVASRRRHADGAMLIRQEDQDQRVCLLVEGRADVFALALDGKLVTLDELGPGSVVGVLAAFGDGTRSASVRARGSGEAAWISHVAFQELMRQPGFAGEIHAQLATIIRDTSRRVLELSTLSMRDRLIHELLRRCAASSDPTDSGDRVRIRPSPTQSHLATCIGTSREAVAREIGRLTRVGLITRDKHGLVVPSRAALAEALR